MKYKVDVNMFPARSFDSSNVADTARDILERTALDGRLCSLLHI